MTDHSTCWASGYSAGHDRAHRDASLDEVARAVCREGCAFMGEPPCWSVTDAPWPNPECNEPGCHAIAAAALAALRRVP